MGRGRGPRPRRPGPGHRGAPGPGRGPRGGQRRGARAPGGPPPGIVSASRRTDLPARFAPWLLARLEEGFAEVPHPFAPTRVRRVDLRPAPAGALEALVLWTRDPSPLLGALPAWEAGGLRTLWLVTITGYPAALEPAAPDPGRAVAAVRDLARVVGPERVSWRYDPVLLCPAAGVDRRWHRENFTRLAGQLAGSTARCVVSLYDDYAKARRRLAAAGLAPGTEAEGRALAADLADRARAAGIALQSCCEDLADAGIPAGACIDGRLLDALWGIGAATRRDAGQRPGCRCAPSVDLGVYDTCGHGCLYCYATTTGARARTHDPTAPRVA
ncbi:MAG: DUF1848 domain-containing protein [Deferrisomatales bacterium]